MTRSNWVRVTMEWLGGPKDGATCVIETPKEDARVLVTSGSEDRPEHRYVRPRQVSDGHWVLPFYEGQIVDGEETR